MLIVIFFISCKKEKDFRDKYIGEWNFNAEISEHNTDSIGYIYHDSLTYAGTITHGVSKNDIVIKYINDKSVTLSLNEDGKLSNFPTQYCNGNFESGNKIYLYLRWGGIGGGITHKIRGVKR